jgi:hypothetical protein
MVPSPCGYRSGVVPTKSTVFSWVFRGIFMPAPRGSMYPLTSRAPGLRAHPKSSEIRPRETLATLPGVLFFIALTQTACRSYGGGAAAHAEKHPVMGLE